MASPDDEARYQAALNDIDANLPESPVGDLEQNLMAWRAVYEIFLKQDFTTGQAAYLTACFLLGNPGMPPLR